MINRSILISVVICTAFTLSLLAQDLSHEVLDSVQKKYRTISNLSADFKQSNNGKTSLSGKIYYSRGNKLRLELKNSTIISDGTTIWNYNKSQNKVVINNVSGSDPSSFTIDKFLFDYPSKSIVTLEKENDRNVLVIVPQEEKKLNFKKTKILVSQDYLIIQVNIENLTGTITNFQLSNYKLNQNLPDSRFSFSPPEGTNIIDLRK
jgi:chaperone LolA